MDRRVTLQVAAQDPDRYGSRTKVWSNLPVAPTVSARVWELRGDEDVDAQATVDMLDLRVRLRWRTDLSLEHRLVYQDIAYDIISRQEIGRREGLELLCRRVS